MFRKLLVLAIVCAFGTTAFGAFGWNGSAWTDNADDAISSPPWEFGLEDTPVSDGSVYDFNSAGGERKMWLNIGGSDTYFDNTTEGYMQFDLQVETWGGGSEGINAWIGAVTGGQWLIFEDGAVKAYNGTGYDTLATMDTTDAMHTYRIDWTSSSSTLTIDGGGTIAFPTYTATGDGMFNIGAGGPGNGSSMQIDNLEWNVPEPATMALLGLGGLALIRRKRKTL